MRVVSQDTLHVGVGRLATASGLLGLLLFHLNPGFHDLVLVRGNDARFVQGLLDSLGVRDLDLVPNLLELWIKMLDQ